MTLKLSKVSKDNLRQLFAALFLPCLIFASLIIVKVASAGDHDKSGSFSQVPNLPFAEFDIRAIHGTPRGTDLPTPGLPHPSTVQLKALASLKNVLGLTGTDSLRIEYNGLTATPRHIVNSSGYLSEPSSLPKEQIARNFIAERRAMFRFSDADLNNLKLVSRATSPTGTTTMLFNQRVNGMGVFNGSILVNVAGNGQIVNLGGDSYPEMTVINSVSISPQTAIQIAAADMGISGFSTQSLGEAQVLETYGDLAPEFVAGEKFSRGTACNPAVAGVINCSVGAFPNNNPNSDDPGIGEINAGDNQILITVTFDVATNAAAGDYPVTFRQTGLNSPPNVANDLAQQLPFSSVNGVVTVLPPRQLEQSLLGSG